MTRTYAVIGKPLGCRRSPERADGRVACQACGAVIPQSDAVRACYQCAYDGKSGFACGGCARFVECVDCLNVFCPKHADPAAHVRNQARNVLDTCSKRTSVLNRIIDSSNRRRSSGVVLAERIG